MIIIINDLICKTNNFAWKSNTKKTHIEYVTLQCLWGLLFKTRLTYATLQCLWCLLFKTSNHSLVENKLYLTCEKTQQIMILSIRLEKNFHARTTDNMIPLSILIEITLRYMWEPLINYSTINTARLHLIEKNTYSDRKEHLHR